MVGWKVWQREGEAVVGSGGEAMAVGKKRHHWGGEAVVVGRRVAEARCRRWRSNDGGKAARRGGGRAVEARQC